MNPTIFLMALAPALLSALGAAALILLLAALFVRGQKRARWRAAAMPIALATGFIIGYAILFEVPKNLSDLPWKMSFFVAVLAGIMVAAARLTPKAIGILIAATLVAGSTYLLVPRFWEGWPYFAAALAAALVLYILSLLPAWHHERFWLIGPVVMWICVTAASYPVLLGIDQILGRMLILLACLAGLAALAGIFPPLRLAASTAGPFLAIMFGSIILLAVNYNPGFPETPTIPLKALVLLACGPLGAAVTWLPPFRNRPWWALLAAVALTAAIVTPGALIAAANVPDLYQSEQ